MPCPKLHVDTFDSFFEHGRIFFSKDGSVDRSLKHSLSAENPRHEPVLLKEVMDLLKIDAGDTVIDGTLGLGGHAAEILKRIGPDGRLIAFEWDQRNRVLAEARLGPQKNLTIVPESFSTMRQECEKRGVDGVDAILLDLGISSAHLDDPARGFSFRAEGPLDMRMDSRQELTAETVLRDYPEQELADIFFRYGEERMSRKIAQKIVQLRKRQPATSTRDLMTILEEVCPRNPKKSAARIFQAIRIEVNHELDELRNVLPQACSLLKPGGRLAVITFHSLEDRLVKNFFREAERESKNAKKGWQRINKKVIIPDDPERQKNPRSRSAKLRVIQSTFL